MNIENPHHETKLMEYNIIRSSSILSEKYQDEFQFPFRNGKVLFSRWVSSKGAKFPPPFRGKKLYWPKMILHALKTNSVRYRSVSGRKRAGQEGLKLSYSFLMKDPLPLPRNGKRSFCLKMLFRKFRLFSSMFFLVEKWPILTSPPPFSGKFHYYFLNLLQGTYFFGCVCGLINQELCHFDRNTSTITLNQPNS